MKYRRTGMLMFLALFSSCLASVAATPKVRDATCYVLIEEGDSAEGNSMYLKMALDSQGLALVAPTRFSLGAKLTFATAEGSFSSERGQPTEIARKGRLVLYSVPMRIRIESFPKASKTVSVDITMADLSKTKDLIQPGAKAIELAAIKAKMKSGIAWIIGMQMPARTTIRVQVGLAK